MNIAPSYEQPVRVSISEAARLFGVNARTIRRALQEQELRYIVVQNRYKILFTSLIAWSQQSTHIQKKRDQKGIGQWVEKWKIRNTLYSPRPPGRSSPEAARTPQANKKDD
ncbi:DNA-binding protein [Candidatus Uhrbacteria bacterium]|nr:DNA-binding protein [Candidatus Uhrbacteria bacterium]